MGTFVRRVRTASGATAVQIVHKRGRSVLGMEHVGSARDEVEVALLMQAARERIHAGQGELPLGEERPGGRPVAGPVVTATPSLVLWEALEQVYADLGFETVKDRAFKQLVLGRIVEPTSKIDTLRVLGEIGVWAPSISTVKNSLARVIERKYRDKISTACYAHAAPTGRLGVVLYDLTTLYFETPKEDSLRKVGMSKERRVDPQVTVGLLCDATGFPLQVHLFEGNKAETKTLIPVVDAFREAHDVEEFVVVADAGMLSAANLLALEDAGLSFIVGSRAAKTPYDLAHHFKTKGNHFTDGQTVETTRAMGTGKDKRTRRVVYHYSFKRSKNDDRAINAMVKKAEDVAAGTRPLKRDRFVKIDGASKGVDWDLVARARSMTGLKGYVTNISTEVMDGPAVVAAYQDLYQVERSFRMAKSDLRARPVFARTKDSIEAHLTIVFAALAISREAQQRTGASIKKILNTLRPLRSAVITSGGSTTTAAPAIP
ncbi:IS1634 family transposase, partial [Ornithinimicrobium sp. F0845]|uniref:IS1634 family transposase n=1 Tax=Ornithinimicrobium sp. F0845 TaxID=2926412 RepID=UPI001FF0ECA8|nr:IS1634 family transposase [Ornithinimicrobium sp. F0845]